METHAHSTHSAPETPAPTRIHTLRHTTGRCPTCLKAVPAQVVRMEQDAVQQVWLQQDCPEHGTHQQRLSADANYWEALDQFYFKVNRDEYPQRDYIIRMTERCNLSCPICLARANTAPTEDLELSSLIPLLSQKRGIKVDLMAAEPTLRADLEDWIRRVKSAGHIAALHTNGLRLQDRAYLERLKQAGLDEVFLQFDGLDDRANTWLRGRALLAERLTTLENLRTLGIATSLIVVIAGGLNDAQVGETFRFALRPENDHIREVFFMGLRLLGSARDSLNAPEMRMQEQALMPDDLIERLVTQEPRIRRDDIRRFNMLYFSLLSALKVRKCLYIQHYLVTRDGQGGYSPVASSLDLEGLERAALAYRDRVESHPILARAGLLAAVAKAGLSPDALHLIGDHVRLGSLLHTGMNLKHVPRRQLLLGFITACDPYNYDDQVALNCGKGELSVDGGFTASSATANVDREARMQSSR